MNPQTRLLPLSLDPNFEVFSTRSKTITATAVTNSPGFRRAGRALFPE
jgi:hypothetical protein